MWSSFGWNFTFFFLHKPGSSKQCMQATSTSTACFLLSGIQFSRIYQVTYNWYATHSHIHTLAHKSTHIHVHSIRFWRSFSFTLLLVCVSMCLVCACVRCACVRVDVYMYACVRVCMVVCARVYAWHSVLGGRPCTIMRTINKTYKFQNAPCAPQEMTPMEL